MLLKMYPGSCPWTGNTSTGLMPTDRQSLKQSDAPRQAETQQVLCPQTGRASNGLMLITHSRHAALIHGVRCRTLPGHACPYCLSFSCCYSWRRLAARRHVIPCLLAFMSSLQGQRGKCTGCMNVLTACPACTVCCLGLPGLMWTAGKSYA